MESVEIFEAAPFTAYAVSRGRCCDPSTTVNAPRSEVGQRQVNQQQRIGNGIRSGQMSPGEAARAENQQQHINQQVHADRQANDSTREPQRTPGAAVELKSL
jgi:hypothetical protein